MIKDTELYILSYDNNSYLLDDFYKIIQCGAEVSDIKTDFITDNTGDNISEKNPYFVETTGIYWIWKNTFSKYIGHTQYRRYLSVNPKYIDILLKEYDIILANPIVFPYSLMMQYSLKHNLDDILEIKEIINEKFPEYIHSFNKCIEKGNVLFYSNSFITKREIYNDICNFCFSILFEFEKRHNLSDEKDRYAHAKEALLKHKENKEVSHIGEDEVLYQSRFCGYLFERLLTLYVFHNDLNIYTCGDYIKMQNNMKI